MKIAIVGSRKFPYESFVRDYVRRLPRGSVVISGACPNSPDAWAAEEARKRGLQVVEFPVDKTGLPAWPKGRAEFGKRAFERNQKIVDAADILIAFWDGKSKGTHDSVNRAKAAKIPHAVIIDRGDGNYTQFSTEDPKNLHLEPVEGH